MKDPTTDTSPFWGRLAACGLFRWWKRGLLRRGQEWDRSRRSGRGHRVSFLVLTCGRAANGSSTSSLRTREHPHFRGDLGVARILSGHLERSCNAGAARPFPRTAMGAACYAETAERFGGRGDAGIRRVQRHFSHGARAATMRSSRCRKTARSWAATRGDGYRSANTLTR